MKLVNLSLMTATSVSLLVISALPLQAEPTKGFDFCHEWYEDDVSNHNFLFYGSCYNGAHDQTMYGRCNVHDNYPCFYCTLGC